MGWILHYADFYNDNDTRGSLFSPEKRSFNTRPRGASTSSRFTVSTAAAATASSGGSRGGTFSFDVCRCCSIRSTVVTICAIGGGSERHQTGEVRLDEGNDQWHERYYIHGDFVHQIFFDASTCQAQAARTDDGNARVCSGRVGDDAEEAIVHWRCCGEWECSHVRRGCRGDYRSASSAAEIAKRLNNDVWRVIRS